jgi:hypothetical protein
MQRFLCLAHLIEKQSVMKKIAYSILAIAMLLSPALNASAQSETRSVSDFNSISSAGPFDVHININGTESLKINASADLLKDIETTVDGGQLEIKFKRHTEWTHENTGKIDIYITAKSLSSLANAGSGFIKVEGAVTGQKVDITLSGSGNITSAVKSAELYATLSGSGSIRLNGTANQAKVVISGSGEVNGKGFKTGSASVVITGSGNAYFGADKSISAHIVGSGSVVYTGRATVRDTKTIGSGSVSKAD